MSRKQNKTKEKGEKEKLTARESKREKQRYQPPPQRQRGEEKETS